MRILPRLPRLVQPDLFSSSLRTATQREWDRLYRKVLTTWAYVDSLAVRAKKRPSNEDLKHLTTLAEPGHQHVDLKMDPRSPKYRVRIQAHQPTVLFLVFLHSVLSRVGYRPGQVHFALDLVTSTEEDAWNLKEFIDRYVLKRRHGRQRTTYYKGTRYTAKRGSQQIVTYVSVCKVTGELYCCHVEWRAESVRQVRGLGIYNLKDLLNFDHEGFWRKNLLLVEPDTELLGRRVMRETSRSNKPKSKWFREGIGYENLYKYVARLVTEALRNEDGLEMQVLKDWLTRERIDAKGVLSSIYPNLGHHTQ